MVQYISLNQKSQKNHKSQNHGQICLGSISILGGDFFIYLSCCTLLHVFSFLELPDGARGHPGDGHGYI